MREVASSVDYSKFSHLSVERFILLSRLVRYDEFSDGEDWNKAAWLQVEEEDLKALRATIDYRKMTDQIRRAFTEITTPKMFKDHLADAVNQDKIFRKLKREALLGDDAKWAAKAAEKLVDGIVPKAATSQQAVIIQIGEEQARLIEQTLKEVRQLETSIDAEYSEIHAGEVEEPEDGGP